MNSPFQDMVGQWAELTFTQSTRLSVLLHLRREVEELIAAEKEDFVSDEAVTEEAADCYLLLTHYAHKCRFSLGDAAIDKFIKNTLRDWSAPPDHEGVVEHRQCDV